MKNVFRVLFAGLALLLSTGCMVDWAPVVLHFCIQNNDGDDLLNPESELYIGDQVVLSYKGHDYIHTPETKTYAPVFSGLKINKNDKSGRYEASFGELDGEDNYDDDFIITLPDGSSRTIHYDRKVNEMTVSARSKWLLDGKKVDSLPITIVY